MEPLVILLLSLIIVAMFIILIGHGIRIHALKNTYNNVNNIVSCDKYKLSHYNTEERQLLMGFVTILTGYGILFTFLVIATIKSMFLSQTQNSINMKSKPLLSIISIISTVLVMATISYKIWVYVRYSKKILSNKLSNDFYSFSNISTFLILCFVFCYMSSIMTNTSSTNVQPVICVLGLLGIIVIAMSHMSIVFFSTDG